MKSMILKYICENMEEIINNGMDIIDITIGEDNHPHYHSRRITRLEYDDEEECMMVVTLCSGSPSCWNRYEARPISYMVIAKILEDEFNQAIEESVAGERVILGGGKRL